MILLVNIIFIMIIMLIGIYMYHFIKRILNLLLKNKSSKYKRVVGILITLIIIVPTLDMSTMWVLLVILHIFFISLIMDLINFIVCKSSGGEKPTLKRIYNSGIIPILMSAIILSYGYINMHNIIKTDYTVYSDKVTKDDGYRIAFISDLHYGVNMNGERLQKECDRIEKSGADIVVLGGDIVDENTTKEEMIEAFNLLSQIGSTYGTFYVYGNHDKASYSSDSNFTEEELANVIESSGINILEDEAFDINNEVAIIGRKDRSFLHESSRKSADELKKDLNMDTNKYNILVDHQPCELEETSSVGYDILMSGHTHAGQIWPGGMFIKYVMKDTMDYGHVKKGDMDIVVSSGIAGWKFPIRTEEHCEYVILNIMPK